ncbi:hypothetical protein [Youxingia wuxianensis]|uniref:Uncharacterized protein n=1 Tax=Youxingia wuxianensis TaxID=2763678 RepID=A0A926EQT2_9FIRM|nr:hypothetical protein [Youxingia wuxianensis]MBC8584962.1 hypothetical protein [Youxingia wuxianensis]
MANKKKRGQLSAVVAGTGSGGQQISYIPDPNSSLSDVAAAGAGVDTAAQPVTANHVGSLGEGSMFVFAAATVANILCDNLSQTQINLLGNFLSVVTTCVFAILTVESPNDILEN